jgi:outer membrane protein OmpA-like peptidoglycan-associated protein
MIHMWRKLQMLQRIVAVAALSMLSASLYAQGLTTSARATDWEEINFEFNSSVLTDGYPSLLRLAELLGQHPDYKVRVIGHTDYVGSSGYNQKLAQSRANTVRDFLLKYGATAGQVSTVSEGKGNPAYTNRSKEAAS